MVSSQHIEIFLNECNKLLTMMDKEMSPILQVYVTEEENQLTMRS